MLALSCDVKLSWRSPVTTSSALKVAPTMVTSSLKVIPTATSDRGLAIGHYADKSRVPLVKAVATCDTDKENICPTKSGCLAITVAATNPYSVHMVTPSSYQQPVVHQALVQKQPTVTQVAPWLHQQAGNSNMMAQRVAMPMGRPQLHNYTTHRSVTMGQHHGMGTLNIVTRIPAPQPLPYTLAAPATFYPSLRPPSYYHWWFTFACFPHHMFSTLVLKFTIILLISILVVC